MGFQSLIFIEERELTADATGDMTDEAATTLPDDDADDDDDDDDNDDDDDDDVDDDDGVVGDESGEKSIGTSSAIEDLRDCAFEP
jgi:hypothetical protein